MSGVTGPMSSVPHLYFGIVGDVWVDRPGGAGEVGSHCHQCLVEVEPSDLPYHPREGVAGFVVPFRLPVCGWSGITQQHQLESEFPRQILIIGSFPHSLFP